MRIFPHHREKSFANPCKRWRRFEFEKPEYYKLSIYEFKAYDPYTPVENGFNMQFSVIYGKILILISDFMQTTSFYLERFLKKLADDQCSPQNFRQYLPYQTYVDTSFCHGNGLTCARLMEVSTMFNICRYCIFTC